MPDTRHFYTQPLQLVTASVKLITYSEDIYVNKDVCVLSGDRINIIVLYMLHTI